MNKDYRRDNGIDLFDLAEFPLAVLGDRHPTDILRLEFTSGKKRWILSADPRYGFTTPVDSEVYVALLDHSRGHDPYQNIGFRRRQLIQSMGWALKGESFERLDLSLRRWRHLTITAMNAVHDPKTGTWIEETDLQLVDSFRLYHRDTQTESSSPWQSWFRWGGQIADLLAAGYHHEFNTRTYMRLKSPIAQAEFRYLSARMRDGKPLFEQHLGIYAQQHIGLRQSYPSKIKEKLEPGHQELIACGFLEKVNYGVMQSGPCQGEPKIIVYPGLRRGAEAAGARPAAPDPLVARLTAAGLSAPMAAQLAAAQPEECARQLEYLPHRAAKNPGGALRRAIQEQWAAPPAYRRAQRQAAERQAEGERAREAQAARAQGEVERQQRLAAEAAFLPRWLLLPEAEQRRLVDLALERLPENSPLFTQLVHRRDPANPHPLLLPLLTDLLPRGGGKRRVETRRRGDTESRTEG